MINDTKDIGFVQDITQLDQLRRKAVSGDKKSEKAALEMAAKQFESVFATMLMKSMRSANRDFKSDLFNSQTEDFYRKMLDEQMASNLSSSGKLGLADMIVAQLSKNLHGKDDADVQPDQLQEAMKRVRAYHQRVTTSETSSLTGAYPSSGVVSSGAEPRTFKSPQSFVQTLKPYAEKAARALGIDSSLLLAQAALETGWGTKVIGNAQASSHNLFNIKADRSWQGNKVTSQTLEYQDNTPVLEKAAFRAYDNYQDSFNDYVRFLSRNPRYMSALANHRGNDEFFIHGIHRAGYATDPDYAKKVLRVQAQIQQMD
jgi:flagellar protein FlgJ